MIRSEKQWKHLLINKNIKYILPEIKQTVSENRLKELIKKCDAWIIGDDLVTKEILTIGANHNLKCCVKWGIGTDNIDIETCKNLNIAFTNTPNQFGEEVSDVAIGFLINLTRQLHNINNDVKNGLWTKYSGESLSNKKACVIGFGDIGQSLSRKLLAFNINVFATDPMYYYKNNKIYNKKTNDIINLQVHLDELDKCLYDCNFIFICCPLNKNTRMLINKNEILLSKKGVIIINISRGNIVNEDDVYELLNTNYISSIGFDVFNKEPVYNNKLLNHKKSIFTSHNSSNTIEAVDKVNKKCINFIFNTLNL